jgi:transcription termination factor Rho
MPSTCSYRLEALLDRKLVERRIFPAVDFMRSGTRREELLQDENVLRASVVMRRLFAGQLSA